MWAFGGRSQRGFLETCLSSGMRTDRRTFIQLRDVSIDFPLPTLGTALVKLGGNQSLAAVACELVDPAPTAPRHGFLEFSVSALHHDRSSKANTLGNDKELTNASVCALIEKLLRSTKALDTESLCVLPGRKVWSVRVDVTILADEGNALDCSCWAALAALMHFKRPELSIVNDEIIVHPPHERDPVPLTIHHTPLTMTFAIWSGNSSQKQILLDPTKEEIALVGNSLISIAINTNKEICLIQKVGGVEVEFSVVQDCIRAARGILPPLFDEIKKTIAADAADRRKAKLERFKWVKVRSGVGKDQAPAVQVPANNVDEATSEAEDEPAAKKKR